MKTDIIAPPQPVVLKLKGTTSCMWPGWRRARMPGCGCDRMPGCGCARMPGCGCAPHARMPACPHDRCPHIRMPACLDGGVQLRLASPASPFLGVSPSGCLCCSVALCLCGFTFLLPQRVCCAQQCARLGQHALASEQALDGTAPTKNSSDKQVSSWRHISCHTDKNRYYT